MARIRSIKPALLQDEKTAMISHEAFRCFIGMITLADDYGNMRGNPAWLSGQIFWGTKANIDKVMTELSEIGLINLYRVDGQDYVSISGWSRHQKVDKPGKPLVPGPSESSESVASVSRGSREIVAKVSDLVAPDKEGDKDKEGEGEGDKEGDCKGGSPSAPVTVADQVREVWGRYEKYHPSAKLGPPSGRRWKMILRALRDYPPESLIEAIDGLHVTPWNIGENPEGKKYLGIHLALGSSDRIDQRMLALEQHREGTLGVSRDRRTITGAVANALSELRPGFITRSPIEGVVINHQPELTDGLSAVRGQIKKLAGGGS